MQFVKVKYLVNIVYNLINNRLYSKEKENILLDLSKLKITKYILSFSKSK